VKLHNDEKSFLKKALVVSSLDIGDTTVNSVPLAKVVKGMSSRM
jgi:hypothetical protein